MTANLSAAVLLILLGTGTAPAQVSGPDTMRAAGREENEPAGPYALARREGLHFKMLPELYFRLPYLLNPRSSAPIADDTVYWNTDAVPDTCRDSLGHIIGLDSAVAVWVNYSSDNQASWESIPQQRIDEVFYEETWDGMRVLPDSGNIAYYCAARNDSGNISTGSPSNASNTWPPGASLLAYTGDEPDDDCQVPDRPNLELTDFRVGYSNEYIYLRPSNSSGGWPYRAGILGPWFIYGAVLANPRVLMRDSSYVYLAARMDINIPGIIVVPPGLYRMHVDDPFGTLTKVGDIDQDISGNRLDLRFLLSDLLDDPEFGPYEGYLGTAGISAMATRDGEFIIADITPSCRFYQSNQRFAIGANAPPFLAYARVSPEVGEPEDTFRFSVTYQDPDNHLPVVRRLIVGADSHTVGSPDRDYVDGASFSTALTGFPLGWHRFHFEFSDGEGVIASAVDSFQVVGLGREEAPGSGTGPRLTFAGRRLVFTPASGGPVKIELFDAVGRRVWSVREHTQGSVMEIELPQELRTGVYFLNLAGPGAATRRKLVLLP